MGVWTWLSTVDADTRAAIIAFVASIAGSFTTVVGVFVTVFATAVLGFFQLRQQAREASSGRTLEIKRDSLLAGIRGMGRARLACAKLCVLDEAVPSAMLEFQEGLAAMTSASAVAGIHVVRRGKDFANTVGPIFMDMLRERVAIQEAIDAGGDWKSLHAAMLRVNVPRVARVSDAELQTIAAIRGDIGVDPAGPEQEAEFVRSAKVEAAHAQQKVEEALRARGYPPSPERPPQG